MTPGPRPSRAAHDAPGAPAGDGEFATFYARERAAVVAVVAKLTGDLVVAEDLGQEAFVRAYQRWSRIRTYERPGAWVQHVAVNLATSHLRRLGRRARAMQRLGARVSPATPEPDAAAEEFWSHVRALPRRQAQAVALYYGADCSVASVAAVLGCEEGTVRAHLAAARRRLAERLGPGGDVDG